eukprot:TRINITY_DN9174_c0_g1_i2.p1 TRINITY_DN9174_c0_g1~~TRINITY_DN9174_c0_g1_i2.p1  ORF type:complete len:325 (-),score=49.06 TRINITY_DN9174_c0_g1_i2:22-912(-)
MVDHVRRLAEDQPGYLTRHRRIIEEVILTDPPDFVCLQEFQLKGAPELCRLYDSLLSPKYDMRYLQRTSFKQDGLAILCLRETVSVRDEIPIIYADPGDRVALMLNVWLRQTIPLTIVNTHLTFPHHAYDEKLRGTQIMKLTKVVDEFRASKGNRTVGGVIVAGDLNDPLVPCLGKELVSDHLSSQGYSHVDSSTLFIPKRAPSSSPTPAPLILSPQPSTDVPHPLKFITHRNHKGEEVTADHIWFSQPAPDAAQYRLEPVGSSVLPDHLGADLWPSAWALSDHRPLTATFVVHPL